MKLITHNKLIVTVLMSVSLLVACSGIEHVPDTRQMEIAMNPLASENTKVVSGPAHSGYPEGETMGVFSFYSIVKEGQPWTSETIVSDYFENVEFEFKAGLQDWAGVTPYYWPLSGSLIFAGYSPYRLADGTQVQNTSFDVNERSLSVESYEVEEYVAMTDAQMYDGSAEYKNKCQSDFMYFLPDTDANGNFIGSAKGETYTANFCHALAQVVFTVQAEATKDVDYIRLRQIVLTKVASKGDFHAQVGSSKGGDVIWTLSDGAQQNDMTVLLNPSLYGGMKLSTKQRQVVELLAIPIGEHDINITYSLIVNGTPHEETVTFKDRWEAGKKYIYNLILGTDSIQMVPQMTTDWVTNE